VLFEELKKLEKLKKLKKEAAHTKKAGRHHDDPFRKNKLLKN